MNQKSQSFCGSPAYLSPEVIQGKGSNKQSDVFGVGLVLYELLTGQSPFYSSDEKDMFKNIVRNKLPHQKQISELAFDLL